MAPSAATRKKREEIVREHMDSENRHEFDATLDTFAHPRYELIATGETYDGPEEVAGYYDDTRRAFPDQRNELLALHHADDARTGGRSAACLRPAANSSCRFSRSSCSTATSSPASASTSTRRRSSASSASPATRSASPAGSRLSSPIR